MALGTLAEFVTRNELSLTTAQETAVAGVIGECEDAIKELCRPTMLEPGTATLHVLNAPWNSQYLFTPCRPVRSITALYIRRDAKGDPSLFTSDYLKVAYTDYRLVIDRQPEGWGMAGKIEILNMSVWGVARRRPYNQLGWGVTDEPGSVAVSYTYGFPTILPRVTTALYTATAMLLARRKLGVMASSASLNGASYSLAGPATATAVVHSPDVLASLYGLYDPLKVA